MLHADGAAGGHAFEHEIDGHQHRFEPELWHGRQNLGHGPVATRMAQ